MLGEHANALLVDLESVYCAGAFVTVVILACAIVDSHLREVELGHDYPGGMKGAFEHSRFDVRLQELRQRRNDLVHLKDSSERRLTVDDQWFARAEHKAEAIAAVELVADVLFENPWT